MAKLQVGFDFGTGDLKIAVCDGSAVRKLVVQPVPDRLVKQGRIVSFEAMSDFLKQTVSKHRLGAKNCAVVLPSGLAYLRRVRMPAMTTEQLKVNLPYEFRDYLTMDKDKYFYDYALDAMHSDNSGKPVELELTTAAVEKRIIGEYSEMFRRAGFRLQAAAPVECAYLNVIRAQAASSGALEECCILDLGHEATRIHIFHNGKFEATRVIELGTGSVDRAIADTLGIDEFVARSHKEANLNGAQELQSAISVYNAIAVEIMKAVNFYGFNNQQSNLRHCYFCGGGARIPALMQAISSAVDLVMHPAQELLTNAALKETELGLGMAAIGIAMQ